MKFDADFHFENALGLERGLMEEDRSWRNNRNIFLEN